ncbi:MAG: septum formation initiator family protein [Gemmatimonadetes bacterium]|nr:septum formation initiator family protein [Gemmatimonadota bacterium]
MVENRRFKTPRELRRQKLAFWGACGALVAYAVLGGDYKLYHLVFLSSEKDRLTRQIDELRAENSVLATEERRLQGDSVLLERMAREKGMKKPGEIVYRLIPVQPQEATVPDSGAESGVERQPESMDSVDTRRIR